MQKWMLPILFTFYLGVTCGYSGPGRAVTNEDIRDAILSVVNMIRATEDKLERHEYRERALGDNVKKALSTIDKRQRLLDPVKGTISRLDERLATVETILMQKDERERIQQQKALDMVEQIYKNLPEMLEKLKNEVIEKLSASGTSKDSSSPNTISKSDLQNLHKNISEKIESLSSGAAKKIETQLSKIQDDNSKSKALAEHAKENLENVKLHLNNTGSLLEKYETKLAEFNNRVDVAPSNNKAQTDLQVNILRAVEVQKTNIEQILSDVKKVATKLPRLPELSDLDSIKNETLQSLEELKYNSARQGEDSANLLDAKLRELKDSANKNHEDLTKSVDELGEMTELLSTNIADGYEQLKNEVHAVGKVEQVMVQTADSVLDTKRRVEYGVHQILLEVGDLVKVYSKEVNATINERFDKFETSVLDPTNGALTNLTSKIGHDIDQVWRQIGIMHQQMSANADTLTKLQNQTDSYVNGSLNTMDTMRGKVGKITSRMAEVDDNLNYLLGRLSLVTQEFNQIKKGLGSALDEIKSSFQTVQQKLKDAGPGPHQIPPSEENEETTNDGNTIK